MVSYAVTPFQRARELHGGDTAFIGKWVRNARARKEQKRADKQEFKLDKIEARGAARAVARSTRPGFLEGAGNALNTLLPGILGAPDAAGGGDGGYQEPMYQEPPRSNNSMLIIGVVVVLLVVVGVVVYMKRKK